ncbi:MAG: hypothetical protein Q8942_20300, partial [Bacillota bacterium]|nr:hypothetical protein [Bacillota bacterium]
YEKDFTLKMQLIRLHFTIKAELFATYESRYIFCNIKNGCKMFIAKYIIHIFIWEMEFYE